MGFSDRTALNKRLRLKLRRGLVRDPALRWLGGGGGFLSSYQSVQAGATTIVVDAPFVAKLVCWHGADSTVTGDGGDGGGGGGGGGSWARAW